MSTIAFIDDDRLAADLWTFEMSSRGYNVVIEYSVNGCRRLLSLPEDERPDFFIIDVMMPPGPYKPKQTRSGLYTGILLAREVRQACPKVPIILLSLAPIPEISKTSSRAARHLQLALYVSKRKVLPDDIADIIDRYFKELKLKPNRWRQLLRKFSQGLLLGPNVCGVGIDLKKMMENDA